MLFCLFFWYSAKSQDFLLICSETSSSYEKTLNKNFSKIVNFKEKSISNFSGSFFDRVILFGENEIIVNNTIFDTRSTFNISTNKWTTYKGQFIKFYDCTKEKRRF